MAFDPEFTGDFNSAVDQRRERRRNEDKKRMAYRRAIEAYRESQALQASFSDFPELLGQTDFHRSQRLY